MCIAPGQGQTTPLRQNFDVNRNSLSLRPFVASLKKNLFEVLIFYHFLYVFPHVYSPRQVQTTHWGQKFASFKIISSKSDFIHIFNDFIHVYSPFGSNFKCQQKAHITSTICCKFQTNLFEFWFYTHFSMFFHMFIAPGQGQAGPCHFSFKKISLKSDFIHIFACFKQVYSPRAGAENPMGVRIFILT